MNNTKLFFSSLLLSFLIIISTSIRAVANTQVQTVVSSSYLNLSGLISLVLIIGLVGSLLAFPMRFPTGLPKEPSLPPEEDREPI